MESDLAVEMFNFKMDDTFQVSTLIGDDDSTTMAMVRQQVNQQVQKWTDVNHAKKSLRTVAMQVVYTLRLHCMLVVQINFCHLLLDAV